MIYRRMQKMRIIREKSLRNLPKPENNKKNNNDTFNYTLNSFLLATSTFGLYKFFSNNKVKIEDTSIHELKEKKDNFEKITIVNDKTAIIKKKTKEEYYRVNIPSVDYFEKKIETDVPIIFESSVVGYILGPVLSLAY